jgi:hypothetical protein
MEVPDIFAPGTAYLRFMNVLVAQYEALETEISRLKEQRKK